MTQFFPVIGEDQTFAQHHHAKAKDEIDPNDPDPLDLFYDLWRRLIFTRGCTENSSAWNNRTELLHDLGFGRGPLAL
jgi:hypothetical protein